MRKDGRYERSITQLWQTRSWTGGCERGVLTRFLRVSSRRQRTTLNDCRSRQSWKTLRIDLHAWSSARSCAALCWPLCLTSARSVCLTRRGAGLCLWRSSPSQHAAVCLYSARVLTPASSVRFLATLRKQSFRWLGCSNSAGTRSCSRYCRGASTRAGAICQLMNKHPKVATRCGRRAFGLQGLPLGHELHCTHACASSAGTQT